jgi:FixJ family two-component response regulator
MLIEEPLPADLLATAREVLLAELLPALPPEKVFAARMIANAMAIAARAAEQPDQEAAIRARIQALAGDARALAAAIRAGRFDPGTAQHAAVATLLDDITRARCAVSAPRALGKG